MADSNIRWAFNTKAWTPDYEEVMAATSYIQLEEKERIDKFLYQDDAKSSMVGRLLMRKFAHVSTGIPYNEVRFGRDERGKPYLMGVGDIPINFNVSHQGDYAVLAGNKEKNIGVDVMKIEAPANKNVPEFFRLMRRQFSTYEWDTVKQFPLESQQMACFYRLWCLKEAYVKNIGVGITIPLINISFSIKTFDLKVGEVVTDTKLYVNGVKKHDWLFEETLVDEKHTVAVSIQSKEDLGLSPAFSYLNFEELVKEAKPLCMPDAAFTNKFMTKEIKHF